MPGVPCPLANRKPGDIDFWVVRENTEGEYSAIGGKMFPGTEREVVVQETVMSRIGVDRVLKFAFELARSTPKKHLTSATKSNGIAITMPYWDERVKEMAKSYPDVKWNQFHIDILTARFVMNPDWFNVVVASNLFGDILSDLGPACTGTIGIARPAISIRNANSLPCSSRCTAPRPTSTAKASPIRSSDLVGRHDARHLGEPDAAKAIVSAIEVLAEPKLRTRDLKAGQYRRLRQSGRRRARLKGCFARRLGQKAPPCSSSTTSPSALPAARCWKAPPPASSPAPASAWSAATAPARPRCST